MLTLRAWPRLLVPRLARYGHLIVAIALSCVLGGPGLAQSDLRYAPPGATPDVIKEFLGQGQAAFRRGDYAAAMETWRQAARMCRANGLVAMEGQALASSAEANLALGFTRVALADLTAALERASEASDTRLVAAVSGALGNAYLLLRQYPPAEEHIVKSVEIARRIGDRAILASASNNLGNLLAATGRSDKALAAYAESAAAAGAAGDYQVQLVAARNAARLQLRNGEASEALHSAESAMSAAQRMPMSHARMLGLVSVGALLARIEGNGRAQSLAYTALRAAAGEAETTNDQQAMSLAYGYMGSLYERAGRTVEAMLLTERAADLAQRLKLPELSYRWDWQLGRLQQAAGDDVAALDAYLRAVRELQEIRRDIPIDYEEGRSSFRETIGPLFLQVADLLMRKAAKGDSASSIATYLSQARDTVERIKQAEIQDFFKDQCAGITTGKPVKVDQVSPNTAVIYPIILPDRTEMIVSIGERDYFATARVSETALSEQVMLLRGALEDERSSIAELQRSAAKLYDWLVRPILPTLLGNNVRTIVAVPDGALRTIPFSALYDGERYLIESFSIATAPGLTLIDPTPLPRQGMSALVAGVSEAVQGFPPIPDVEREVATIGKRLSATTLLNQTFLARSLEQELEARPYKIVHIASHGVFGATAEESYVLSYDSKIDMNKLEELFKVKRTQPEAVELLTLSACSTAAGDDRAPLGLAGVALKSGARSSIASLWSVSDAATAELIADTYAELQNADVTKASALRNAQVRMLKSERFKHPVYWAPFLLIGNWL